MKKIVTSLALASVLVSGLYAQNGEFKKDRQNCEMKYKDGKKGSKHQGGIFGVFYELNLTAEQKTKIDEIIKDSMKNQETPMDAFGKDSFDKAKFTKIMKEKRDKHLEVKAEIIDKAYKILDAKQKEQLKTLLDLRKDKMQQKFED